MREIKFRAFGSQGQGMFPVTGIDFDDMSVNRGLTDCILMQYTGLKDKNGVEIYEEDVVEQGFLKGKVTFEKGAFGIRESEHNWMSFSEHENEHSNYIKDWEILGNLYENPELIETV